jgi:hypothetical protein
MAGWLGLLVFWIARETKIKTKQTHKHGLTDIAPTCRINIKRPLQTTLSFLPDMHACFFIWCKAGMQRSSRWHAISFIFLFVSSWILLWFFFPNEFCPVLALLYLYFFHPLVLTSCRVSSVPQKEYSRLASRSFISSTMTTPSDHSVSINDDDGDDDYPFSSLFEW